MMTAKLSRAAAKCPALNCARANASRTLRDAGSARDACSSSAAAAAGLCASSSSMPRVYQSYTSPAGWAAMLSLTVSVPFKCRLLDVPTSECRTRGRCGGSHVRTIGRMPNTDRADGIPRPDGLVLAPFRALRYDPARVNLSRVLAPPYDVIDEVAQQVLEAQDPHNVVRLTLRRGQYDIAGQLLAEWREAGVLVPDSGPALHVCEAQSPPLDGPARVQRGLVGAL